MEDLSMKSLLQFLLANTLLLFLIATSSTVESARSLHDYDHDLGDHEFIKCLKSQNSDSSITDVVFTPKINPSSYISILKSLPRNLRPISNFPSKPRFIITPEHESHIQATIFCAKKTGVQIRVRSGGHDYEGLSYVSDETETPFAIVDLREFTKISIDHEDNDDHDDDNDHDDDGDDGKEEERNRTTPIATIQAGVTLGQLYHEISDESNSLAFVAGVCPTVGVGGHFSGGGYSMMSRRFGLAAEHIVDAKIIDVNGRILDRKSMGEDLFWAIRGGGGASFGIITEWTVKLLTIPEKVTVFNVSKTVEQNATELIHRWQYIADKIDERLLTRIFITTTTTTDSEISRADSQSKKTIEASFTALFVGGTDELLKVMDKSFPELGLNRADCEEMSWIQSILYFANLPMDEPEILLNRTPQAISYFKGKSDYVQQPISRTGLEEIWKILLEEDVGRVQLQFSPYGGRLNKLSESAIPFPHRAGNIFMIHYGVGWGAQENSAEDSRRHINWIRRLYSYMARHVSKSPRGAYLNYRDLDIGANNNTTTTSYREAKVWGAKYFKNNFDRLVHVKTRVDPTNFFRNEQSIPPF